MFASQNRLALAIAPLQWFAVLRLYPVRRILQGTEQVALHHQLSPSLNRLALATAPFQ
ncbi:MAG: hypothetical protein V8K32_10785 [Candidatus Electrothrix gigas]